MDEVDYAQEREAAELRQLLAAHAYALPKGEAAEDCVNCGDSISPARRAVAPGCIRCLACQERHERRLRGGRQ